MVTQTERDAYAFAELVRKLAIGLSRSAIAGDLNAVQEKANVLLHHACERKRELRERIEADAREDNYDLSELWKLLEDDETNGE